MADNKTLIVGIGNSDDKLTQNQWSEFVSEVHRVIVQNGANIHFFGCTPTDAPWQSASWTFVFDSALYDQDFRWLKHDLKMVCSRYKQDSIALTVGDTELLSPGDDNG